MDSTISNPDYAEPTKEIVGLKSYQRFREPEPTEGFEHSYESIIPIFNQPRSNLNPVTRLGLDEVLIHKLDVAISRLETEIEIIGSNQPFCRISCCRLTIIWN